MFGSKDNPQNDPLIAPDFGSQGSDALTTSLLNSILAAREAELRAAEMALEIEMLRRKLELHQWYSSSLHAGVKQALQALCSLPQRPPISFGRGDASEPPDGGHLSNLAGAREGANAASSNPPSGSGTVDPVSGAAEMADLSGGMATAAPEANADESGDEKVDRIIAEAEARAAALVKEASDVLSRAQESAQQILKRALAQRAEVVTRVEDRSGLVDEKVPEPSLTSAVSEASPSASVVSNTPADGGLVTGEQEVPGTIRRDERPPLGAFQTLTRSLLHDMLSQADERH